MTTIQNKTKQDNTLTGRWRKGGMQSNYLRESTNVLNYFPGPGRQNIIPDLSTNKTLSNDKQPISSLGIYQTNGLGQVASSEYGPGTLKSTNIQVRIPVITNENSQGTVTLNEKKTNFVNYRPTDPALIQSLRHNPLSIYAVGDAKKSPIPAFFSYIRPDNYNTYKSIQHTNINKDTIQQGIDGSPQINILGLTDQNPFMGLTTVVNQEPTFSGKTYGGNDDSSAAPYAKWIYDQNWTTNDLKPVQNTQDGCKNTALSHFAQGYNIANQISDGKMIAWIGDNHTAQTNLPWGPKKITGNPITQEGGIWNRGNNPIPTIPFENENFVKNGYETNTKLSQSQNNQTYISPPQNNPYKNGLPGNLFS